jgi:hypothetical protein
MKIRVAVEVAASKPLEVMEVDDGEHAGIRLRHAGSAAEVFWEGSFRELALK